MGAYVSGGTFGVACGPLIGAILFHFFGIHGTALMVLPVISASRVAWSVRSAIVLAMAIGVVATFIGLVVSYYALQFIPPKFRQDVVNKIYQALHWGGAFIWFETMDELVIKPE